VGGASNPVLVDAVYNSLYNVVKLLLDKGADINASNKVTLRTPLHMA
jgi:ankyrin repeat protein